MCTLYHKTVERGGAYRKHDASIKNLLRDKYEDFGDTVAIHLFAFACIPAFLSTSRRRVKVATNNFAGIITGSYQR